MLTWPAPVVLSAVASGASMFGFALFFFRFPRIGLGNMQRIYLAWLSGALTWATCLAHQLPDWNKLTQSSCLDLLCGCLTLGCFAWSVYWFSNLGGGFRILMLLDLADANRPLTESEWMSRYGQGRGMREFLDDRLRSILTPVGLVKVEQDRVALTGRRGLMLGRVLRILSLVLQKKFS